MGPPWGSRCTELTSPAVRQHGCAPHLAGFCLYYLCGSCRLLSCLGPPVLWGREEEGWDEMRLPPLVPCLCVKQELVPCQLGGVESCWRLLTEKPAKVCCAFPAA